jgi:tRNA threonylcarbamoyladenosine biosynthesis protein TsaE
MAAPQPRPTTLDIALPDEAATLALARDLAALAGPGDVIALSGDLGAGKTTFARAFINALPPPAAAATGPEDVPSPTFTLLQIYDRAPAPVWHVDLYRLNRPEEAAELGLEDAFAEAITLIEWPERLGALLPLERLDISLLYAEAPNARRAILSGTGAWPARLRELGRHD